MKKIKEMSKMRKLLLSMLTLVCGVMMFTVLQSNSFERGEKKVIVKEVIESTEFLLECSVRNIDSKDAVQLLPKSKIYQEKLIVNSDNEISIETLNYDKCKGAVDYQNKISKVIFDKNGTRMYDSEGQLIKVPKSPDKEDNSFLVLTNDQVVTLGTKEILKGITDKEIISLKKEGINVKKLNTDIFEIIKGQEKVLIEVKKLKITRSFSASPLTITEYYRPSSKERMIKVKVVEEEEIELTSGMKATKKVIKLFSDIKIIEEGKVVFAINNSKKR